MMQEGFRLGRYTMTDLLEADGTTYDNHIEAQANEGIKRQMKIDETLSDTGVQLSERNFVTYTANEQADTGQETENQSTTEDDETTT